MNYMDAMKYIQDLSGMGSRPGTDTVKELLNRLGNPQNKLKVVHIAGTNGKGSVFTFLAEILNKAGYTVGRYISPAVFTYLERYQIDGEYMTEIEFCDMMEQIIPVCHSMVQDGFERPTAFETETAVAFLYFFKRKVDIVLLETGMGGKEDATNVVDKPLCTVLASISRDHMQFLGNSLTEILQTKMGIMREGVPCVSYELCPELKRQWVDKCDELNCKGVMFDKKDICIENLSIYGSDIRYKGEHYHISMPGKYQIYNAVLAIETAKTLNKLTDLKIGLKNENIKAGLIKAMWAGRFQLLSDKDIPVIVDGAHNEDGWRSLKDNIDTYLSDYQLIFVCGVLADKEYDKMIDILSPYSDIFIALTPENSRALPGSMLINAAKGFFEEMYIESDVINGVKKAVELGKSMDNPAILVFGSLSFIGSLIKASKEWQGGQDK